MALLTDLKTLYHLALAPIRGDTHQERLESFYAGQAEHYDAFRKHLLHGREELYGRLPTFEGCVWIELGGGTGSNLEMLGSRLQQLDQAWIVDLCPALLEQARLRKERLAWNNVHIAQDDATRFGLFDAKADVVTFSYSLTMIPDWFRAIENAIRLLKPGGFLGVVDFYVSRKHADPGLVQHGGFTRSFWPWWLAHDNVFPNPDHLPYLKQHFEMIALEERYSRMRYFPLVRCPYYWLIGRK